MRSRIIPALAGNTASFSAESAALKDHPRSRGEYAPRICGLWAAIGSSPLSRGIPFPDTKFNALKGIIPALAGNTATTSARRGSIWDHPRSRGEYASLRPAEALHNGSSPLSRGIPCRARLGLSAPGIIPALAGNTRAPSCLAGLRTDHPRSRGEYVG